MSSAIDREAAWLSASGDGLPALLKSAGGPWDVIQGYWGRTTARMKTGIYLVRPAVVESRFTNQRKIQTHQFRGKLWWPIGATTVQSGLWEDEQRAFDAAVDLLVDRVRGHALDHTHGGRFLAVAEAPDGGRITVQFADPEQGQGSSPAALRADITYQADDRDFAG
ncbi:hypothetical protein [Pseudonocardia sp. T1-2H]|uniref:hypothetical protein n=1 Tax=Pseudonocardia sp. T1-2H TaxID=3128899 RepID=UPI003101A687